MKDPPRLQERGGTGPSALQTPGKQQDDHHDQDDSQQAGRPITPAPAVPPPGKGADEQEHQDYDEDGSHGVVSFSLMTSQAREHTLCQRGFPVLRMFERPFRTARREEPVSPK